MKRPIGAVAAFALPRIEIAGRPEPHYRSYSLFNVYPTVFDRVRELTVP